MIHFLKTSAFFLLIILSSGAYGQGTEIPGIKERLMAFIDLTNQKNYSEAFTFMYPPMFEFVPIEELVDVMKTMDQNGLSLTVQNPVITSYSDPFVEGSEKFVRIDYVADLSVDLITGSMFDSPPAYEAMQGQFELMYGRENVKWVSDEKRFDIVTKKAMLAIQLENGVWYLADISPDQMELMKALFSETIINKFMVD